METKTIELKIAGYQVHALPTGQFALDGGAMFGTVPKVLWEKSNPADSMNRIPMEARAMLLKGNGRVVVIDCGNGSDFIAKYGEKAGQKFSSMYAMDENGPSLQKSLAKYGVQFEDVTDVILTHLHFDHCGGATCQRHGKIVPTFPKARYYVQRRNWETAEQPNIREKASYLNVNYQPLLDAGVLTLLDGPTEILPGIQVLISDGHTQGQQMVKISDEQQSLIYCADVIPTSSHVRSAWVMGYDLDPLKIISEKTQILRQAVAEKTYLYFEHDPYCDCALVQSDGKDFQVSSRFLID